MEQLFIHRAFKLVAAALSIILLALMSCSDPTGSLDKTKQTSDLTVTVKDTAGIPINGIQVETTPATIVRVTDQNGIAFFDDIEWGRYQVVAKRNGIELFHQSLTLTKNSAFINFTIAVNVTINLTVKHTQEIPLDGITVSTSPSTSIVTIDEDGYSIMTNVPVKPYTFIIKRGPATAYIYNKIITIRDGDVQDLELIIEPQPPQVSITNIPNNMYHNIFDITFEAEGSDFEDGVLPPDAFNWYSDIDGFLGTGNSLHLDQMSVGHHLITLVGKDSNQTESKSTRNIVLYFFSKNSYFPIPQNGIWNYENNPGQVWVTNEQGETESFQFMDVNVFMKDVNARTSTMMYYNGSGKWYQYTVIDYYDNDFNAFYVVKTIEIINSWDSEPKNDPPKNTVTITTTYDNKYPLFENHLDLSEGSEIVFSTEADVDWLFEGISYGSQHYLERMDINSQTSFEGYETIETEAGTYETAKLHIVQGDTERFWWLAKGYGIVQYSFNTFDTTVIASLTDTNLDEIQESNQSSEKQLQKARSSLTTFQQTVTSQYSSGDNLTDIRQIIKIIRMMVPR